jgi:hypothetical protein
MALLVISVHSGERNNESTTKRAAMHHPMRMKRPLGIPAGRPHPERFPVGSAGGSIGRTLATGTSTSAAIDGSYGRKAPQSAVRVV